MSGTEQPELGRGQARKLAARRRNAALARVASARRWVIGGSVGLTFALALLVDAVAPGHSVSAAKATAASGSSSSSGYSGNSGNSAYSGNSGNSGNSGSVQSSSSSQQVTPVVSGGS